MKKLLLVLLITCFQYLKCDDPNTPIVITTWNFLNSTKKGKFVFFFDSLILYNRYMLYLTAFRLIFLK